MPNVFMSYVRDDAETVTRLAALLRNFEINVWLDTDDLKPGTRWRDAIRNAISEGDFFIACFSGAYLQRQKTYMNEELTVAIDELRLRPTDRVWFIPVKLSACDIPDRSIGAGESLRSLQWVDLTTDWAKGVEKLVSVIQPTSTHIHHLMASLDSRSERERLRAIEALGRLGSLAAKSVPRLVKLLERYSERDDGALIVAATATALGLIGIANDDVLAALRKVTDDRSQDGWPRHFYVDAGLKEQRFRPL